MVCARSTGQFVIKPTIEPETLVLGRGLEIPVVTYVVIGTDSITVDVGQVDGKKGLNK